MRIGVVGVNYKLADLRLREKLARTYLRHFSRSNDDTDQNSFVILLTCNRTEVYFRSEDLAASHMHILAILREEIEDDFDQKLYSYFGQDCLLHLCRVTTGLDSAIVAETEIQGQVKTAYESAVSTSPLPEELHYLFQKALKTGKQVRSKLLIQRGLPDLEHAILQAADSVFNGNLDKSILFVGASQINCKILAFLKSKSISNITLCNRTEIYAQEVARSHDCMTLEWKDLQRSWHKYDWIILGTKSPDPLITADMLPPRPLKQKLLIDLSVPRNVDTVLGKTPNVTLLNIDQLDKTLSFRRQQILDLLAQAETLIMASAKQHAEAFTLRQKQREEWLAAAV